MQALGAHLSSLLLHGRFWDFMIKIISVCSILTFDAICSLSLSDICLVIFSILLA